MIQKYKKAVIEFADRYQAKILILIIILFLVFNVLNNVPYLNILLNNFFVKIAVSWLVAIFIFEINYIYQLQVFIATLLLLIMSYFFGAKSYENLGNILYLLLLVIWFSYWKELVFRK